MVNCLQLKVLFIFLKIVCPLPKWDSLKKSKYLTLKDFPMILCKNDNQPSSPHVIISLFTERGCAVAAAVWGRGEKAITTATHAPVQRLVYTCEKQVSITLATICQLTLCEGEFWVSKCCAVI